MRTLVPGSVVVAVLVTATQFSEQSVTTGSISGRFSADFGDAGVFSGDFIAPTCATASAGCSAAPGGLLAALVLPALWLRRRRRGE